MKHRLSVVAVFAAAVGLSGPVLAAGVEAGAKVDVTTPAAPGADAGATAKDTMQGMHDMGQHMGHEAAAGVKAGASTAKDAAVSTGEKVGDGAKAAGQKTKHAAKKVVGGVGSTLGAVGGAVQGTTDAATSGVSVEAGAKVEKK